MRSPGRVDDAGTPGGVRLGFYVGGVPTGKEMTVSATCARSADYSSLWVAPAIADAFVLTALRIGGVAHGCLAGAVTCLQFESSREVEGHVRGAALGPVHINAGELVELDVRNVDDKPRPFGAVLHGGPPQEVE